MERLTKVINGVCTYVGPGHKHGTGDTPTKMGIQEIRIALNRLATYEDTGLEPKEITVEKPACVFYCNRKCNLDGDWCPEGPGCQRELSPDEAMALILPPNPPLTLEELREMDGERVWVVPKGKAKWKPHWFLLNTNEELAMDAAWSWCRFGAYGVIWLAYRRKPEEEKHGLQRTD